jgi:phage-related protein
MTMPGNNEVTITVRVRDATRNGLAGIGRGLASLGRNGGIAHKALGLVARGMAGLAAANAAVSVVGALGGALVQLAPAALMLPGILLGGAAAMATFKIATAGFGEALKAADPAAFAKATKDMAPAMRETLTTLRGLKPQLLDLKKTVQQNFWQGFSAPIKALAAQYLPVLKTGLGGIATEMNRVGVTALNAFRSTTVLGSVGVILNNTRAMIENARTSLANFGVGFVKLGAIGSTYLPAVGTAIDSVAAKFNGWVSAGMADGSIKAMIDNALVGFRDLGTIIANVGSIIGSVVSGLGGAMASPLAGLAALTTRLAEFMSSAAAQGPLQALGETMRVVGTAVGDVLLAGLNAVAPLITAAAPLVQALATALSGALVGALAALGPPITALVSALGTALMPILPVISELIVSLAQAFAPVVAALAPVVQQLGAALLPVVQQLAPIIADIAMQLGQFLAQAITTLAPIIPPLVAAIGSILAAVLPVLPPLIQLASAVLPLIAMVINNSVIPAINIVAAVVTAVFAVIVAIITAAVAAIVATLSWFENLPAMFQGWLDGVVATVRTGIDAVIQFFRDAPGAIMNALGNLGNLLVSAGRSLVDGLWNGIKAGWDWLTGAVRNLAGQLLAAAKSALGIGSPSKLFRDEIGKFIPQGMALGIEHNLAPVTNAGQKMASAAVAGTSSGAAAAPGRGSGCGGASVTFGGNVDSAFATAFMRLVREGAIQIQAAS